LPSPESIWNGNEPKPDEAVDNWEPVDKPRVRLSGGGGRLEESLLNDCWTSGEGGKTAISWCGLEEAKGASLVNDCLPRGETGGDLTGLLEMGDGGTKGKDSRIESARVEAAETAEEVETLRFTSKP
jgi:hypothetical protein